MLFALFYTISEYECKKKFDSFTPFTNKKVTKSQRVNIFAKTNSIQLQMCMNFVQLLNVNPIVQVTLPHHTMYEIFALKKLKLNNGHKKHIWLQTYVMHPE